MGLSVQLLLKDSSCSYLLPKILSLERWQRWLEQEQTVLVTVEFARWRVWRLWPEDDWKDHGTEFLAFLTDLACGMTKKVFEIWKVRRGSQAKTLDHQSAESQRRAEPFFLAWRAAKEQGAGDTSDEENLPRHGGDAHTNDPGTVVSSHCSYASTRQTGRTRWCQYAAS